jgi:lipopolysaccharide biosynthesis glycosyltransferase
MCLDNDDDVLSVLRYFKFSQIKIDENWFGDQDALKTQIGIDFDQKLLTKYKDINASTKENNGGMCSICFCEFEDELKPFSLSCGHQYCEYCWSYHLK